MKSIHLRIGFALLFSLTLALGAFAQDDDQITAAALSGAHPHTQGVGPRGHLNGQAHARFGIFGIDSIPNFNGQYFTAGVDNSGNFNSHWYYNTVGNPPQLGGTTPINAPIVPVTLDLRNFDGSPRFVGGKRLISSPTAFVTPVLNSPVFANSSWDTSSTPTQITDAIQRAEYWGSAKSDWHTVLNPSVKTGRTMTLVRGTYRFALNADGSCCFFVLIDYGTFVNKLFPPTVPVDNTTVIGAAELAGDMTTSDMTTLLFPNAYLYLGGNPNDCCILGFHSFDFEPGDASNSNRDRFYVMNYSSWISPGIFGGGFQDVTALSHEVAETFNDPFVVFDGIHDLTPWWLAPNGNCQNDLETGDVIEGLPNAVYPITMNGFTYHPQNEALLQWFQFEVPSDAFKGAYSYPNRAVLTSPSAPQNAGCQ
jgi:hypothetical protein